MKKLFILMISLIMVFTLTACTTKKKEEGNKTNPTDNTEKKDIPTPRTTPKNLTCSKDFSDQMTNGVSLEQEMYMEFNDEGSRVTSIIMSMNFELPENLASASSTFINTMKTTYDQQYGKYEGVKVELKTESDTEFSIIISLDFTVMSDADKKALGFAGSEDYTVNRTSFINSGYTCE